MAFGIHFGIFLIYSVAEHVSGSWDPQADGVDSQRYDGYRNVGFSQEDAGKRQLGGRYTENKFRQVSITPGYVQNEDTHRENLVKSAYNLRSANRGTVQTSSQLTPNGYYSANSSYHRGMVPQSSYGSAPGHNPSQNQVKEKKSPSQMKQFVHSDTIASGSAFSMHKSNVHSSKKLQSNLSGTSTSVYGSKDGAGPTKSTMRPSQYQSSSHSFFDSPPRESYHSLSTPHRSSAQNEPYRASADSRSSAQNEPYRASADSKVTSYYGQKLAPSPSGLRTHSVRRIKPSPQLFTKDSLGSSQTMAPNQHWQFQNERRGSSGHFAYMKGPTKSTSLIDRQKKVKVQSDSTPANLQQPNSPKLSSSQRLSYNPSHTLAVEERVPSSASSAQNPWDARNPTQEKQVLSSASSFENPWIPKNPTQEKLVPSSASSGQNPWIPKDPTQEKRVPSSVGSGQGPWIPRNPTQEKRVPSSASSAQNPWIPRNPTQEKLVPRSASSGQNPWIPKNPTQERVPNTASSGQISFVIRNPTQGKLDPRSASSGRNSNQKASNLPASNGQIQPRSGGKVNSKLVPIIYQIPKSYGGSPIRRLGYLEPLPTQMPNQSTTTTHSQKRISYSQQAPIPHQESQWMKMRSRTNMKI